MKVKPGYFSTNLLRKFDKQNTASNCILSKKGQNTQISHPSIVGNGKKYCSKKPQEANLQQYILQLQNKVTLYEDKFKLSFAQLNSQAEKFDHFILEINRQFESKAATAEKYANTIKGIIYWLIKSVAFIAQMSYEEIKTQMFEQLSILKQYIEIFQIEKQLQTVLTRERATLKHSFMAPNSIFTQDLSAEHSHSFNLLDTFDFSQSKLPYQQDPYSITKKLFQSNAKVSEDHTNFEDLRNLTVQTNNKTHSAASLLNFPHQSVYQHCQLKRQISGDSSKCDFGIVKQDFTPNSGQDNFIVLKKGETVKLLRKVKENVWIGECGEIIGYVFAAGLIL